MLGHKSRRVLGGSYRDFVFMMCTLRKAVSRNSWRVQFTRPQIKKSPRKEYQDLVSERSELRARPDYKSPRSDD